MLLAECKGDFSPTIRRSFELCTSWPPLWFSKLDVEWDRVHRAGFAPQISQIAPENRYGIV
jgi:hypothetical protein